ncbi:MULTISPECIES: tyrosine recombinase XerS [Limosilactobacillus]|uniref:Site-specific tyrosine recombinase XerS n=1 Tax=Limosilactobacillus panis DSM 6035 TaxID=1423782 RepID=A0A0R1XAN6_9LACO|nr:tyrosine recombinase XerS [Limosilactobacillus panis]KRM24953.1 site-specific tyrosine recombinase XerS [Limosilactobacillus panis DSM 6035]QZN92253.1 tyrosine recombinase XerS [Limosilactobacillus panis]
MEADKYLNLIQDELKKLPDYVNEYYLGTNHAVTTTYQYLTEIRRFFDWLRISGLCDAKSNREISTKVLEKLRRNDIMLYIDHLKHTQNSQGHLNSPTSINRSINALRSLFKFLTVTADVNDGEPYFYRNVMAKIDSLNDTKTLNYRAHTLAAHMYRGQMKFDFINFINNTYPQKCDKRALPAFKRNKERDVAIIALILGTGVRVSEAANTNLADLNIKEGLLDVVRKGGQKDSVPIAPWATQYIKDYLLIRVQRYHALKKDIALFLTVYHGTTRRMTANSIERMVKKYSTAFGHPLTPHKLRHTLASEMYEVTKDQVLVAQQLGQKGTSATDLYTHVDQHQQRAALKEISDEENNK